MFCCEKSQCQPSFSCLFISGLFIHGVYKHLPLSGLLPAFHSVLTRLIERFFFCTLKIILGCLSAVNSILLLALHLVFTLLHSARICVLRTQLSLATSSQKPWKGCRRVLRWQMGLWAEGPGDALKLGLPRARLEFVLLVPDLKLFLPSPWTCGKTKKINKKLGQELTSVLREPRAWEWVPSRGWTWPRNTVL